MNNLFVLRKVEDFAAGAFENTAVDDGGVQLGRRGTGHLLEGSYTSQPFSTDAFRALIPSWNADTPPGTSIEVQVRVQVQGVWSEWFGFGHWSSFQHRSSPEPRQDTLARVESEWLRILPQIPPANAAQIRVHLHTEVEKKTPTVLLMAVSVLPDSKEEPKEKKRERVLNIPMYSSLVRDPSLMREMNDATALTMLMNRWGTDLLPEEVARGSYDIGAQTYSNLSFLSSVGGVYGFVSYVGFGGLDALRREIWKDWGVAALVRYRKAKPKGQEGQGLPQVEQEKDVLAQKESPVWLQATEDSAGHLLVVCGFLKKNGEEYVVIQDPLSGGNDEVKKEIQLSLFLQMYQDIYVVLHRSHAEHVNYRPQREQVHLQIEADEIFVSDGNEPLIPGRFSLQEKDNSTLCYTLSSSKAYASAAQREFYYLQADEEGRVKFDKSSAVGKRLTFYRVGPGGYTWVAEKWIESEKGEKHDNG